MLSLAFFELTLQEVVADLPHDGGTVVVFLLLLAIVGFIWHGSRRGSSAPEGLPRGEAAGPRPAAPTASRAEPVEPEMEPVRFDPALLSTAPELGRLHPEVK